MIPEMKMWKIKKFFKQQKKCRGKESKQRGASLDTDALPLHLNCLWNAVTKIGYTVSRIYFTPFFSLTATL